MQKQKGISTLAGITIIIVVAVILFGGVFSWQYYSVKFEARNLKSETNSNVQNSNASLEENQKIAYAGYIEVDRFLKKYSSISPQNINTIKEASDYNRMIDAFGRNYAGIYSAESLTDKNIIYFSAQNSEGTSRVYRLNINTNALTILRKEPYVDKNSANQYDFILIGIQGNKLLLEKRSAMNTVGPCRSIWVYAYKYPGAMQSLDLNNLNSGLSIFYVSEEQYNSELIKENTCMQEINRQRAGT